MLSQVKYSDLSSYGLGMKQDLEQGREEGETVMLHKLLEIKFDSLPKNIDQRLQAAGSEELLYWSERILSADTLLEIFAEH